MKTSHPKPAQPLWHVIDADGQTLGKVAVAVARLLRGKHRATFVPHQLCGDHVVVLNAQKLSIPGNKAIKKVYYHHTGYLGGMRSQTLEEMMRAKSNRVIEAAIKGMLPRNKLRAQMLKRLHVFTGAEHPYGAQKPAPFSMSR